MRDLINTIICGDCLEIMRTWPDNCIDMVVMSPPYFGLRDYGVEGQLGLEKTPEEYVNKLVIVFKEIKRILKSNGCVWLNLGDCYGSGSRKTDKPQSVANGITRDLPMLNRGKQGYSKQLIGIPWMTAFALRADGWFLRQEIIWNKTNPLPESVRDRCTKSHEQIFLLSKSSKYYFDYKAIQEKTVTRDNYCRDRDKTALNNTPGRSRMGGLKTNNYEKRNKRSVWTVSNKPTKGSHRASYPPDLIRPCIRAGCPDNGLVFDPFMGSGTTAIVAIQEGKNFIGCELKPSYVQEANKRIQNEIVKILAEEEVKS